MRFWIESEDGKRYGPADLDKLNAWLSENKVRLTWMVTEEVSGDRKPLQDWLAASGIEPSTPPPTPPSSAPADPLEAAFQVPEPSIRPPEPIPTPSEGYMVIHPNGTRYGPISIQELVTWMQQGRVMPEWLVVDNQSKQQMSAVQAVAQAPSMEGHYASYPRAQFTAVHNPWKSPATILGGLSILSVLTLCLYFLSIPLGIVGIVMGVLANKSEKKSGNAGLIMSCIGLALGIGLLILGQYVRRSILGM